MASTRQNNGLGAPHAELTNLIFQHLLCVYRYNEQIRGTWGRAISLQKVETSILRVSKTVHDRAMQILYRRNPWVLVIVEDDFLAEITQRRFRRTNKVGVYRDRQRFEDVALKIRVGPFESGIDLLTLILLCSLYEMPTFYRLLSLYPKEDLSLVLNFGTYRCLSSHNHELLFDCFEETWDLLPADAYNVDEEQGVKFYRGMIQPLDTAQPALDRAGANKIFDVRSTHRDDISFIDWLATQITRGEDSDLGAAFEENEDTWIEQFLELREILSHLCVPLSMQLDNRGMAQMELADMNLSWRKGWMSSYSYAVMNNPFGKLSVLRGLDNCALFCFMLAMWQVPGYLPPRNTILDLQTHLEPGIIKGHDIISQNAQHVLLCARNVGEEPLSPPDFAYAAVPLWSQESRWWYEEGT
ncbi:hypothetical protein MMC21_007050 [Puttea exsequens]|nr:hypothetical protein [Puttea exsequens]